MRAASDERGSGDLPRALVIGGLDYVQPLAMAGIRPDVMAPPLGIVRHSRHIGRCLPWADPRTNERGFIEALVAFGRAQAEPPVLFVGGDWDVLAVARAKDELEPWFRFVLPKPHLVEDLVNKARFRELAASLGLPTPPSLIFTPTRDQSPVLPLDFPYVIKPATRDDSSWVRIAGGSKAIMIEGDDDLERIWAELSNLAAPLVAQQAILGPETRIESYHLYIDQLGRIAAEFTGRKIRTFPAAMGHSTALEITDAPDVIALGRWCVDRIGLTGVAKLDFKRNEAGDLCLLEVNPRFSLWALPAARAGVNLPAIYYADLAGLPRSPSIVARPGVTWMDPLADLQAARAHRLPWSEWLRFYLTCETRTSLNVSDPLPSLAGAWNVLRRPKKLEPA